MFKKYPSIENTYQEKNLIYWLNNFPEIKNEMFYIQEKIHGSNFQIEAQPNGKVFYGSRNQRLGSDDNFMGCQTLIEKEEFQNLVKNLVKFSQDRNENIVLYGELYGEGVQKGVRYPKGRHFAIFDIRIGEMLQGPIDLLYILEGLGAQKWLVPFVYNHPLTLEEALDIDVETLISSLSPEGDIAEGIVIKPSKVYVDSVEKTFILKKKSTKFKEKSSAKSEKVKNNVDPVLLRLNGEFKSYLTDTRMDGIISKFGQIEKPSQIGEYIRYLIEDAQEDFLKDFGDELEGLDKKSKKVVYSIGPLAAELVKKHL